MKLFTCPDGTVFVLDHIRAVEPILKPCLSQCPLRFFVIFAGGGSGCYPSQDDAFPNIKEPGDTAWEHACSVVPGVRMALLKTLGNL